MNWQNPARRTILPILISVPLLAGSAVSGPSLALAAPDRPAADSCYDPAAPLSVEEQRLTVPLAPGEPAAGPELVRQAGFTPFVDRFAAQLCRQSGIASAHRFLAEEGARLWRAAVDRAQGRPDADLGAAGTDDRYDDRPLYWARLELTKAVRQWQPGFPLSAEQRAELVRAVDYASRGIESPSSSSGVDIVSRADTVSGADASDGVRRIMVSGFDPFQLDGGNVNRSNPAGAAALQLDGTVFSTPRGPVRVRAVEFPVLWGAFDEGIVESAYGARLSAAHRPDLITTISQGYPGKFTIERWAANWRGGEPDNNRGGERGPVPPAARWPQPASQFIETTLPYQQMVAAHTGSYPVEYHQLFCVWPDPTKPGVGTKVSHPDGAPAPGDAAAYGGGGDYLSNESMYRSNRLRIGLGLTALPGGHLHTPVLANPRGELTGPQFEADRRAIVDQTVSLIHAAGGADGPPDPAR